MGGETPDLIPNSEAKPVRPMVVLWGESRSSPRLRIKLRRAGRILRQAQDKFIKADSEKGSAFWVAYISFPRNRESTHFR